MKTSAATAGHAELFPLACAVIAVLSGVAMDAVGKLVAGLADPWQVMFLRWVYGIAFVLPAYLWIRRELPRMGTPTVHLLRVGLNLLASYCHYYALAHLPLGLVLSIFFTEPLFALLFARLLLAEAIPPRRWLAAVVGLAAAVAITRPDFAAGSIDWGALAALVGAAAWGLLHVLTKRHGGAEPTLGLMLWLAVLTAILAAPMAIDRWQLLAIESHVAMAGVAFFGALNGWFWITALMRGGVALVATVSYLSLPLAYATGYVMFGEVPDAVTLAGSAVLLAAVVVGAKPARQPGVTPAPL